METSSAGQEESAPIQVSRPRHKAPLSPISQLSPELIAEILRFAFPQSDSTPPKSPEYYARPYMRMLYNMRLVAKQWQEIIDGTPTFWKFIYPTLPSRVKEATILRSSHGPLLIMCANWDSDVWTEDEDSSPEGFLREISNTYPRWFAYSGPPVRGYLETPAPRLQEIHLVQDEPDINPLNLLGGQTTGLRYVDLWGISLRWEMGMFTQLRVLRLRHVERGSLTTIHLLDFIRLSPRLEYLELYYVDATIGDAPSSSIMTLHNLQSIIIHNCEPDVITSILRQIRAPSCVKLNLKIALDHASDSQRFLDETFPSFQEMLHATHQRSRRSSVRLGSFEFEWYILPGDIDDCEFYVSMVCDDLVPCIRWVERILQSGRGLTINLSDRPSSASLETIAPMRCVTGVLIGDRRSREVPRILKFLGEPLSTNPSLPSLPCLQELSLAFGSWDPRDLVGMVHSRFKTLSWEGTERPPLLIKLDRGPSSGRRQIIHYAPLIKIRETNGVECVQLVGSKDPFGMLAVIWNDEESKPAWG